jgi:phosphatidylserine/phosphatidylglycerophosphate/cardiolipin synthase-like enzyme
VLLQSPYLILSDHGLRTLERAAQRGVAVTFLTNSPVSSDSPMAQAAFLDQWPEVLARVPTARLYVNGIERVMHAKVVVSDGVLSFVGS